MTSEALATSRNLLKHAAEWVIMGGVLLAAVWAFAEPWAAEFIDMQVDAKLDAVVAQAGAVDDSLQEQVERLDALMMEQRIIEAEQTTELSQIKAMQSEQRMDIKSILFNLRGLRETLGD